MSLNLDRASWERVKFGDVVERVRRQKDRKAVQRYVAGGHFDDGAIEVRRWGMPDDGGMGSTFTYGFRPGEVLFVSASWYLRKIAVATFDGVVADKTYVMTPRNSHNLAPRFLPWILMTEHFYSFAAAQSTGSMNARLLWTTLSKYEFYLPPLDQQERIADLLWKIEEHQKALRVLDEALVGTVKALVRSLRPGKGQVGDVLAMARAGATPLRSKTQYYGGAIPWLKSGEVSGDAISSTAEFLTDLGLEESSAVLIPAGAVCVALYGDGKTRGSVGRLGVPMATNQAVLALVPDSAKVESDFLYLWMMSRTEHLRGKSGGAAQKNLSKGLVTSEPFPDLSLGEQRAVVGRWRELRRAQSAIEVERRSLSNLRTATIDRLVGGGER